MIHFQLTKRLVRNLIALTAVSLIGISSSFAAPINGSISLAADNASVNGTSLINSTVFTPVNIEAFSGLDDFSGITDLAVSSSVLDLNDLLSYTMSAAGFGSWVTTSAQFGFIGNNILGVSLQGIFTPDFGGFTAGPAEQFISITQSGRSYSWSATLSSVNEEPSPVPEPSVTLLVGVGLIAVGLLARRSANNN